MKMIENSYNAKREMDILDAVDEVKDMNKRLANVNHEDMISKIH